MLTRLWGGAVFDPARGAEGTAGEIWLRDERIVAPPAAGTRADYEYDLRGHLVMAGGIDVHTHIGGGKLNLARMLLPDVLGSGAASRRADPWELAVRDPLLRSSGADFLPPAPLAGRRYLEMGYTACFEPAMMACNARSTHAELADVPGVDSGAYVLLGNDDCLLEMIRDAVPQPLINAYVANIVVATRALGVKVVNAGGIHAFKYNQRRLDVDEPHARWGVTPAQIIRRLSRAVDEIGLPQPLHVHCSNLGQAGNIESTRKTVRAADGHRLHLTHVQFHSYGDAGPKGFSSAAESIARLLREHPRVTIDIGQVMFGQTVTLSADTMHQFAARRLARPRKSILLDVECEAGCGVVPFRYEDRRYVNALQWAIGLELFLMVDDPSRVFLTTDHPNGGPFTSYPHLLKLLMDRSFRQSALEEIEPEAADASQLRGLDREYTLSEVAEMTRRAPADFLGLRELGRLTPGSVADVAVYRLPPHATQPDWERVFASPTHVFRRGRLVVRDGRMIDVAPKQAHAVEPHWDRSLDAEVAGRIARAGQLPLELLRIEAEELPRDLGVDLQIVRGHAADAN
jgi:formylmethanofuran dehydrogenase subunit A